MSSRTGGGKEVLTTAAVAVGVGMAALGLGLAGAAFGAGVLAGSAASNSFARRAKPPLRPSDVRRDELGRVQNWAQLLKAVQHGGIAPELRAQLWPLLLGVFRHDSTQQERDQELERLRRLYIKLVLVCRELDAQLQALRGAAAAAAAAAAASPSGGASNGSSHGQGGGSTSDPAPADSGLLSIASEAGSASVAAGGGAASTPLPLPGNLAAFAEAHRIIVMDAVRTDLRRGTPQHSSVGGAAAAAAAPTLTILPVAVGEGLPELMSVGPLPPDPAAPTSEAELAGIAADPAAAAAGGTLPRWRSALAWDMVWGAAHLDEPTRCQMLRLVNLLSAYSVHDPETGYCQGMSDLASIFVQLFDDDALAFACFERLMRSARRNFRHDETGIRHQLQQIARVLRDTDPMLYRKLQQLGAEDCMFAYRMVVVLLRRELPPAACCTLWEMQWAHEATDAEATAAGSSRAAAAAAAAAEQQLAQAGSGEAGEGAGSGGGGSGRGSAAGLRSTVEGLSAATSAAIASRAALQQRPGSGRQLGASKAGAVPAGEEAPEFVLQFIASVVRAQRGRIISECHEHDDVLRLFAGLQIDFWLAVAQARKQHKAYTSPGPAGVQRI